MTINRNSLKYGGTDGLGLQFSMAPCNNTTSAIKAGDMVYWDSSAKIIKPVDTDAHAATLVGVAQDPSAPSSGIDNSTVPLLPNLKVAWGGIFMMKSTAAETYTYGAKLYVGADAQTVTTDDNSGGSTHPVGTVAETKDLTGAAGVYVAVRIKSNLL